MHMKLIPVFFVAGAAARGMQPLSALAVPNLHVGTPPPTGEAAAPIVEAPPLLAKDFPAYDGFVDAFNKRLEGKPLAMLALDYYLQGMDDASAAAGEWVEFGSFSGKTMRKIADARFQHGGHKQVHGFDSFQGLPEQWRSNFLAKAFDRAGTPPFQDPEKVIWHVGWFNETVGVFAKTLAPGSLTFLHMDADLYSSTSTIFKALQSFIAPGAYIVFDELVNYEGYKDHEMKALYEMLQDTGRPLRIVGISGTTAEQVLVQLL